MPTVGFLRRGRDRWVPKAAEASDEWNLAVRGEQPQQRADRNFTELLQELRVMQTGVQVLFALVLTVAYTGAFDNADMFERVLYVITLGFCAVATAMLMAPVAYHRTLFHQDRKADLVRWAHRLLWWGMFVLMLTVSGATALVLERLIGTLAALFGGVGVGLVFLLFWFVLPLRARLPRRDPARPGEPADPVSPPSQ